MDEVERRRFEAWEKVCLDPSVDWAKTYVVNEGLQAPYAVATGPIIVEMARQIKYVTWLATQIKSVDGGHVMVLSLESFRFDITFSREAVGRYAQDLSVGMPEFHGVPVRFPEQEAEVGDWVVTLEGHGYLAGTRVGLFVRVTGVDSMIGSDSGAGR